MNNLFISTRIKLTVAYTLTIMLISGAISGMFYYRTTKVIEGEYDRIERRMQMEMNGMTIPPQAQRLGLNRIQPEDLIRAKQLIILQLFWINGLIVVMVGAAGYWLSGLTLRPIQASMDKQKRFVADAAHELKTPITALKTSLEVNLMDKKMESKFEKILKENLDDVTNLENLTNNLLKMSKFEDQKLVLVPVKLTEVTKHAINRIKPLAADKKIKIVVDNILDSDVVVGYKAALIDLMVILLDNAVKYSESNTQVNVNLDRWKRGIEISITDRGIGISEEHQTHIFDRFFQVDASRSSEGKGGFGLGLAVAKTIVELHRGQISLSSVVDKGSTFKVSLLKPVSI